MTTAQRKQRWMNDAISSLTSACSIAQRVGIDPKLEDIQAVKSAANQARQAAKELDTLSGMLEVELENKK